MFTYKGNKGHVKLGVEGGVRDNISSNVEVQEKRVYYFSNTHRDYVYPNGEFPNGEHPVGRFEVRPEGRQEMVFPQCEDPSKAYITPKVEAQFNASTHISLNAKADLEEANIGIRYTF